VILEAGEGIGFFSGVPLVEEGVEGDHGRGVAVGELEGEFFFGEVEGEADFFGLGAAAVDGVEVVDGLGEFFGSGAGEAGGAVESAEVVAHGAEDAPGAVGGEADIPGEVEAGEGIGEAFVALLSEIVDIDLMGEGGMEAGGDAGDEGAHVVDEKPVAIVGGVLFFVADEQFLRGFLGESTGRKGAEAGRGRGNTPFGGMAEGGTGSRGMGGTGFLEFRVPRGRRLPAGEPGVGGGIGSRA